MNISKLWIESAEKHYARACNASTEKQMEQELFFSWRALFMWAFYSCKTMDLPWNGPGNNV